MAGLITGGDQNSLNRDSHAPNRGLAAIVFLPEIRPQGREGAVNEIGRRRLKAYSRSRPCGNKLDPPEEQSTGGFSYV